MQKVHGLINLALESKDLSHTAEGIGDLQMVLAQDALLDVQTWLEEVYRILQASLVLKDLCHILQGGEATDASSAGP